MPRKRAEFEFCMEWYSASWIALSRLFPFIAKSFKKWTGKFCFSVKTSTTCNFVSRDEFKDKYERSTLIEKKQMQTLSQTIDFRVQQWKATLSMKNLPWHTHTHRYTHICRSLISFPLIISTSHLLHFRSSRRQHTPFSIIGCTRYSQLSTSIHIWDVED